MLLLACPKEELRYKDLINRAETWTRVLWRVFLPSATKKQRLISKMEA